MLPGALGRHVGDCAFNHIKAVSAQPASRSRQLEGLRAGNVSSLRSLPDHIIKNTVFLARFGGHHVIPLRILLDALDRLPGVQVSLLNIPYLLWPLRLRARD